MESWCAQLAQFYTKCVVFNMTEIMMGVFAENFIKGFTFLDIWYKVSIYPSHIKVGFFN